MIVLESNQNHATIKDTEVVNTFPASMGMGGGYVPMIVDISKEETNKDIIVYEAYQHHKWRDSGGVSGPITRLQNVFVRGDTPLVVQKNMQRKRNGGEDEQHKG